MGKEKINRGKHEFVLQHSQKVAICLMVYDLVAVSFAFFLAQWLRFDLKFSEIPVMYFDPWVKFAPIYSVFCLGVFYYLRLYKSIWRFASYTELRRVIISTFITGIFHIIGITLFYQRMPISYYILGIGFQFIFIVGIRFIYRFILLLRSLNSDKTAKNVMVIGGGAAGLQIIREIRRTESVKEKVEGSRRSCMTTDQMWSSMLQHISMYLSWKIVRVKLLRITSSYYSAKGIRRRNSILS